MSASPVPAPGRRPGAGLAEQTAALTAILLPVLPSVLHRSLAATERIVSHPCREGFGLSDIQAERGALLEDYHAANDRTLAVDPEGHESVREARDCLRELVGIACRGYAVATVESYTVQSLAQLRGRSPLPVGDDAAIEADLARTRILRGVVESLHDLLDAAAERPGTEGSPTDLLRFAAAAGFEVTAGDSVFECRPPVAAVIVTALGIQRLFGRWHNEFVARIVEGNFLSTTQPDLTECLGVSALADELRRNVPRTRIVLSAKDGRLEISVRLALDNFAEISGHDFHQRYSTELAQIDRDASVFGLSPANRNFLRIADTDSLGSEVRIDYAMWRVAKGHKESVPDHAAIAWFDSLAEVAPYPPAVMRFEAPRSTNRICVTIHRKAVPSQTQLEQVLYAFPKLCRLSPEIRTANVCFVMRADTERSEPCVVLNWERNEATGRFSGDFTVALPMIGRQGICQGISHLAATGIANRTNVFEAWGAEVFDFALKMGRATQVIADRFRCKPSDMTLGVEFDEETRETKQVPFTVAIRGYDVPVRGCYYFEYQTDVAGRVLVVGNLRLLHRAGFDSMRLPEYFVSSLSAAFGELSGTLTTKAAAEFLRRNMAQRKFTVPLWLCRQLEQYRGLSDPRRSIALKQHLVSLLSSGDLRWRRDDEEVRIIRRPAQ